MLLAQEWSSFATNPKALRVTNPTGNQLSTYRLNLPYRYGIPLLVISVVLHWLVSQSLYVVLVEAFYNDNDGASDGNIVLRGCGYSARALLITIIVGAVVLFLGIANGFRRNKQGMPLAGSCSAAISAACHPPVGDDRPSGKLIQWGSCGYSTGLNVEDDEQIISSQGNNGIGHCSMTSLKARRPIVGRLYAGIRDRN